MTQGERDLGGVSYLVLAYIYLEFLFVRYTITYAFVCLLSCILLYICDSAIYVIVIFDRCDFYFALSICHITCVILICFCFRVYTSKQMSFVTCTHAQFISFEYIVLAWVI